MMSDSGVETLTAFENPAYETPFSNLPAELVTRILDITFADRTRDVASCRLVSQELHILTSPYLIRTVVIADRARAVQKFYKVARHPYFSKHVTHLLWDGSSFDEGLAGADSDYDTVHVFSLHLTTYNILRSGQKAWSQQEKLAQFVAEKKQWARWAGSARSRWDSIRESRPSLCYYHPWIDEASLSEDEKHDIDGFHLYKPGCTLGRKLYVAHFEDQQSMRADNLSRRCFAEAIESFPLLQHLSFSDFRALAYVEESYVDLCKRLFSNMVLPEFKQSYLEHKRSRAFSDFLSVMRTPLRGCWKTLSIGHHPFVGNVFDRVESEQGWGQEWGQGVLDRELDALPAVETLRLRVNYPQYDEEAKFDHAARELDNKMILRLRDLELHHDYEGPSTNEWLREEGNEFSRAKYDVFYVEGEDPPHVFFQQFLVARRHDFEHLRSLTLHRFTFEHAAMHDLLQGLNELHTLHLIDCSSLGSYAKFSTMIRAESFPSLHLAGAEIYGLQFLGLESQAELQPKFDHELREKMRNKRNMDYDLASQCDLLTEFYPFTAEDWPCERPELETAMLGGRLNNVQRKAQATPNQAARQGWSMIPVQDRLRATCCLVTGCSRSIKNTGF
jgi:hypothetical protein